jgi:hypothetical protein
MAPRAALLASSAHAWLLLVATLTFLAIPGRASHAERPVAKDWASGWSGHHCQVSQGPEVKTPDGETALSFRWKKGPGAELPSVGRSIPTVAFDEDLLAFWFRVDRPIEFLQAVLSDADSVGAETGLAGLMGRRRVEAEQWHYVVWPFHTRPGWVRYKRGQVDWSRMGSLSLYTRPDQLNDEMGVELGPFRLMTFSQLGEVFEKRPDRVSNNAGLPLRVISGRRTDLMMHKYFQAVARRKVEGLQAKYPPSSFADNAENLRHALKRTYLMPDAYGEPSARLIGTVAVDGVVIEKQLLRLRPGVYSTAWIYKPSRPPSAAERRCPAVFMLPGHGDPGWSPAVQSRCLSFARQGYLVMLVQPFGQDERGEQALFNESHDSQSAAFLLVTGQSLLGVIMADHLAELACLRSRKDVDAERIGVTGVSMGGTHSIWLAAIEPGIKVCVPVAAAPLTLPEWGMRHHGLCDLMVGLYDVAWDDVIRGLIAPRPYLEVIPSCQRPISAEGTRLLDEGWINAEDAVKRFCLSEEQFAQQHPMARDVYRHAKAADRYRETVIAGPHDYTQAMRETAAGWFGHFFQGAKGTASVAEPPLAPLTDRTQAVATLAFWPDGNRPADFLTPTAHVQREAARLIDRLPPVPASLEQWKRVQAGLRRRVGVLLRTPFEPPHARMEEVAEVQMRGSKVYKVLVMPESGIELPMVLFAPPRSSKPSASLHVLLHPDGMAMTAASREQKELTRTGAWVLCVDLRGQGETASGLESGRYLGFRDYDLCAAALKTGTTQAGLWVKDLLVAIRAAREKIGTPVRAVVHGDREMGLVAVLAAGQSDTIDAVETSGLLASYFSPDGYGLPYAYRGKDNDRSVTTRPLGGYGSMVPCIPHVLRWADVPQLAALVAPRPLTINEPLWASGGAVPAKDCARVFAWTSQIYEICGGKSSLRILSRT